MTSWIEARAVVCLLALACLTGCGAGRGERGAGAPQPPGPGPEPEPPAAACVREQREALAPRIAGAVSSAEAVERLLAAPAEGWASVRSCTPQLEAKP